MFKKYEAVILFALDGIVEPFNPGDILVLPVTFAEELLKAGSIKEIV